MKPAPGTEKAPTVPICKTELKLIMNLGICSAECFSMSVLGRSLLSLLLHSFCLILNYSWVVSFKETRWSLAAPGPLEECWLLQLGLSARQPQCCSEALDFWGNEGTKLTVKTALCVHCHSLSSCLKGIQIKKETFLFGLDLYAGCSKIFLSNVLSQL